MQGHTNRRREFNNTVSEERGIPAIPTKTIRAHELKCRMIIWHEDTTRFRPIKSVNNISTPSTGDMIKIEYDDEIQEELNPRQKMVVVDMDPGE